MTTEERLDALIEALIEVETVYPSGMGHRARLESLRRPPVEAGSGGSEYGRGRLDVWRELDLLLAGSGTDPVESIPDRISAIRAERDGLKRDIAEIQARDEAARALTAARDAVVEAARKHVPDSEHNTLCAANRLRAGACDCGLTTLCAAVEAVCALEAEHGP